MKFPVRSLTFAAVVFSAISAASAADRDHLQARPEKVGSQAVGFFVDPGDLSRSTERSFVPPVKQVGLGNRSTEPPPRRAFIEKPAPKSHPIRALPDFRTTYAGKYADRRPNDEVVLYSVDPRWQRTAADLVRQADSKHVAIVAMEPNTGRILAVADKSPTVPQLAAYAGAPAASLFKVVTSAAALERSQLQPESMIKYRGGLYTLERWNYKPDAKRDKIALSLAEALGKSCNAVFARVALKHLSDKALDEYAEAFGFNIDLAADHKLDRSTAKIPSDPYLLSRTAAGFGEVRLSPIHAAAFMSGVANGGILPSPKLIDRVINGSGRTVYSPEDWYVRRMIEPETASTLMQMMVSTTTTGTSRREFLRNGKSVLGMKVAAKTGTLRGKNPAGVNNWFIAAAPAENPRVALAVLVVSGGSPRMSASRIGRMFLQDFFKKG